MRNPYGDFLYGAFDLFKGTTIRKHLNEVEKMQWWPRERLIEDQDEKVRRLVDHAYNRVPYYRSLFDRIRLKPSDIRCRKDLVKIPILTKDLIRKHTADRTLLVDHGQRCVSARMSSGSTGQQTTVYVGKEDSSWNWAVMLQGWEWAGYIHGLPMFQFGMSPRRESIKRLKDIALRCHYGKAFGLNEQILSRYADVISKRRISQIMGYASSVYLLAEYFRRKGIHPDFIRTIVTWGDMLFPKYRETIENQFNVKVTDSYGTGEDLMTASQCECHSGYHVFMPYVCVEYIRNEEPVYEGEIGEILITRLIPGPMPLIRYAVGDAGASTEKTCNCGRGLEIMSALYGRNTDIVVTPGGRHLTVHDFTGIFEYYPQIQRFQVRQNVACELIIDFVPDRSFSDTALQEIQDRINEICGDERLKVTFSAVQDIPPAASGKRRFVISNVGIHAQ